MVITRFTNLTVYGATEDGARICLVISFRALNLYRDRTPWLTVVYEQRSESESEWGRATSSDRHGVPRWVLLLSCYLSSCATHSLNYHFFCFFKSADTATSLGFSSSLSTPFFLKLATSSILGLNLGFFSSASQVWNDKHVPWCPTHPPVLWFFLSVCCVFDVELSLISGRT